MDIRRWLQDTQSELSGDRGDSPSAIRRVDSVQRRRRSQRDLRNFADDFFSEPHHGERYYKKKASRKRRRQTPSSTGSSPSDNPSAMSSSSSESSRKYARRPRHKTRADLYDPGSGARKRRTKKQNLEKRARKHREKHRPTPKEVVVPGKPGKRMMHSFKAGNVPPDRLTLKHQEGVGLFHKGRASMPVPGRGLPDLTFSEMSFLKKRYDSPANHNQAQDAVEQVQDINDRSLHPMPDQKAPWTDTHLTARKPVQANGAVQVGQVAEMLPVNPTYGIDPGQHHHPPVHDNAQVYAEGFLPKSRQSLNAETSAIAGSGAKDKGVRSDRSITWSSSGHGAKDPRNFLRQQSAIEIGGLIPPVTYSCQPGKCCKCSTNQSSSTRSPSKHERQRDSPGTSKDIEIVAQHPQQSNAERDGQCDRPHLMNTQLDKLLSCCERTVSEVQQANDNSINAGDSVSEGCNSLHNPTCVASRRRILQSSYHANPSMQSRPREHLPCVSPVPLPYQEFSHEEVAPAQGGHSFNSFSSQKPPPGDIRHQDTGRGRMPRDTSHLDHFYGPPTRSDLQIPSFYHDVPDDDQGSYWLPNQSMQDDHDCRQQQAYLSAHQDINQAYDAYDEQENRRWPRGTAMFDDQPGDCDEAAWGGTGAQIPINENSGDVYGYLHEQNGSLEKFWRPNKLY